MADDGGHSSDGEVAAKAWELDGVLVVIAEDKPCVFQMQQQK